MLINLELTVNQVKKRITEFLKSNTSASLAHNCTLEAIIIATKRAVRMDLLVYGNDIGVENRRRSAPSSGPCRCL